MIHIRHSLIGLCVAAASVGVLAQGADDILRVVSTMRAQFGGHVTRA